MFFQIIVLIPAGIAFYGNRNISTAVLKHNNPVGITGNKKNVEGSQSRIT
jgi:hypothetical protein